MDESFGMTHPYVFIPKWGECGVTHFLSPLWHSVTMHDTVWHDSSISIDSYMCWMWHDSFVESSMTQCDMTHPYVFIPICVECDMTHLLSPLWHSVTWLIHKYSFLHLLNMTWLIRWVLYDTAWQRVTQCDMTHPCVFIPRCAECGVTDLLSPL